MAHSCVSACSSVSFCRETLRISSLIERERQSKRATDEISSAKKIAAPQITTSRCLDVSNPMGSGASRYLDLQGERSRLLGVSLEYLLNDFVLEARQATCLQDPNFHVISGELASGENGKGWNILCPRDKYINCSIVDALDLEKMASPATHFLSWCWSYNLSMYTESWQLWLRENRKRGMRSGSIFVWQCFFCNNQYRIEENRNAINDSLGAIFRTRLLKIRKMVVLLDKFMAPQYLSRVWCVYEMYTALTSSEVSIDFMLPPQQAFEIQDMIRDLGYKQIEESFERVNSESATASRLEDENKVKHEIRQSPGGFAAVDSKVVEKMKEWVKQQFDRLTQTPSNKPTNAAAFLRKSGLDESVVQKLMKAGIKSYPDLLFVKDELQTIGLTQEEENAVHEVLQRGSGSNVATRNWKAELQELGLPYNCFAHLTEEEARGVCQCCQDRSIRHGFGRPCLSNQLTPCGMGGKKRDCGRFQAGNAC